MIMMSRIKSWLSVALLASLLITVGTLATMFLVKTPIYVAVTGTITIWVWLALVGVIVYEKGK